LEQLNSYNFLPHNFTDQTLKCFFIAKANVIKLGLSFKIWSKKGGALFSQKTSAA
jgi:hypothetical protein